jgi:hypothetical protein
MFVVKINVIDMLFRKSSMFSPKNNDHTHLYSLGEFYATKDSIHETTDIIKKYNRGLLGVLTA